MYKKIQTCRSSPTNWKRRKRADSGKVIEELKSKVFTLRNSDKGPPPGTIQNLKWQLKLKWDKEELFWKQKSRINWLQHGDKNTRFFHASVMQRRSTNRISGIEKSDGTWVSDPNEVQSEFKQFFSNLFTSNPILNVQDTVQIIPHKITGDMNRSLTGPVTDLEIFSALKGMEPSKAPGADGMTPLFFQTYWDIVGPDVVAAVKS